MVKARVVHNMIAGQRGDAAYAKSIRSVPRQPNPAGVAEGEPCVAQSRIVGVPMVALENRPTAPVMEPRGYKARRFYIRREVELAKHGFSDDREARANAGGSAICIREDLLPDDAVVTHVITCQGRDHIVNVRSGYRSIVVVNVHSEPELTLRSLRERLRLITPHWPHYPDAIGVIMGDFNVCEPEEGRSNVWNQTFTDGDMVRRLLCFILCFLAFSKLINLITQGETPQSMGFYARCQGLIELLSICLWLRRVTSIVIPMSLRTW